MPAIIGFAVLSFVVGGIVCGGVGFWLGYCKGREDEANKWKPSKDWVKKQGVNYQ